MHSMTFLAPEWLLLGLALPLWLVISRYHSKAQRQQLSRYRALPLFTRVRWRQSVLALLTLVSLTLALARPSWNPQPVAQNEQGRDIIFLLDVSRSMLAADAVPNRLESARQAIRQTVQASKNDRFALVAFAGSTVIKSPLTHDKSFFLYLLEQLSPTSVAHGGTRIEDALFKVIDKMIPKNVDSAAVDLVLISDGEDLGSQPMRAIRKLNKLQVRLLVIGLGDSSIGARVPARNGKGWAFDEGREYWSKMHPETLRELTKETKQGIFFPVGTADFDLAESINRLRQLWPASGRSESQRVEYTEGYPYFLFVALLCQLSILLSRKQKLLIASLVSLSFNSWALSANTAAPASADHAAKTANSSKVVEDPFAQFSQPELAVQAQQAMAKYPDKAAKFYGYISAHATRLETVINANYNQALAYINYAQQLQKAIDNQELLIVIDEDMNIVEPMTYYRKALALLQALLQQVPEHSAGAKNLQWLLGVEGLLDELAEQQDQQKQQGDKGDSEQQEESKKSEKDQQESSEQKESDEQSEQLSPMEINELRLPPPNASAEEIIDQAQQRDQQQRSPAPAKPSQIERDW